MRVLHVVESLRPGGAEQALVNILPVLADEGIESEVVALMPPHSLSAALESVGITVHHLNMTHRWNLAQGIRRLLRVCRRGSYDVIHSHLFFASLYSGLTKPFLPRARRAVTFHNLGFDSYPATTLWRRIHRRLHSLVVRLAMDARIAVSESVAKHYERHLRVATDRVIPNSVPVDRLTSEVDGRRELVSVYGAAVDDFVIVSPARFVPEKGHRYLLDALEILVRQRLPIHALLFGDGPIRQQIAALVRSKRLTDTVSIHPAVPRPRLLEVMRVSDVLVVASTQEGFPLTVGEALAVGTPVVATAVGGIPDLVEHESSGLLVPPQSSVHLANAISALFRDPSLRERIRAGGRTKVQNFDTRAIALQLDGFYRDLVEGSSGRSQR